MAGRMRNISSALFVVACSLLLCRAAFAEIHIGTAGPLSGQYAELGRQIVRGAQQAVDDLNAAGGVLGQQLVLDVADDGCDPKKAVDIARDFIARGVVFVAGHYCSFASIPAAPVYAQAGVVMISPSATNPKFTDDGGWNVNRVCLRDDAQGTFAGEFIVRKHRGANVAVVDDGSPFGQGLAARARAAMAAAGMKEALDASFKTGDKDFTALVSQFVANRIDVVYAGGYHPELGLLVKEMRKQASPALFISADTLVTDEFWTIAGDAAEGSIMTFPPDPLARPAAAAIVAKFKEQDYLPDGFTLYSYAAVQAWAQAATSTGGTDGKKIALWLRSGSPLNTVLGAIALDGKGDVNHPEFDWYRWSSGKYVRDDTLDKTP